MRFPLLACLAAALPLACVAPDGGDDGGAEAGDTDSGDTEGDDDGIPTTTAATTEPGTDDTTDGDTDDTSADDTGTDDTGTDDTGGGNACTVPEDGPFTSSTIEFAGVDYGGDGPNLDVDWNCTVASVDHSFGLAVTLDCPEDNETVDMSFSGSPEVSANLANGDAVRLRHVRVPCFGCNASTWTRLDGETQGHVLTHVSGASPDRQGQFELPYATSTLERLCDAVPEECGEREQTGIQVEIDGEVMDLTARQAHAFGNERQTRVIVSTSYWLHELACEHTVSRRNTFLIVDEAAP